MDLLKRSRGGRAPAILTLAILVLSGLAAVVVVPGAGDASSLPVAWRDSASFGIENSHIRLSGTYTHYAFCPGPSAVTAWWQDLVYKDTGTDWTDRYGNNLYAGSPLCLADAGSMSLTPSSNAASASMTFTYTSGGGSLRYYVVYSLSATSSYVSVSFAVTNRGGSPISLNGLAVMRVNTYIAGDWFNDNWYIPGVGQGAFTGTTQTEAHTASAPWIALWDQSKSEGIGIVVSSAISLDSVTADTYDWYGLCLCSEGAYFSLGSSSLPPGGTYSYTGYYLLYTGTGPGPVQGFSTGTVGVQQNSFYEMLKAAAQNRSRSYAYFADMLNQTTWENSGQRDFQAWVDRAKPSVSGLTEDTLWAVSSPAILKGASGNMDAFLSSWQTLQGGPFASGLQDTFSGQCKESCPDALATALRTMSALAGDEVTTIESILSSSGSTALQSKILMRLQTSERTAITTNFEKGLGMDTFCAGSSCGTYFLMPLNAYAANLETQAEANAQGVAGGKAAADELFNQCIIFMQNDAQYLQKSIDNLNSKAQTAFLTITSHSPVDLLVTTPGGLKIGYDPSLGHAVNEVVGANYTGEGSEPETVSIPWPVTGSYNVTIVPSWYGPYSVDIQTGSIGGAILTKLVQHGVAALGSVSQVNFAVRMCKPLPAAVGRALTCTVSISGRSPTGSITWSSSVPGRFSHDTCMLSKKGLCRVRFTPTSADPSVSIRAFYGGDSKNPASVQTTALTVAQRSARVVVSCRPASVAANSGRLVTCTGAVRGLVPTGILVWSQVAGDGSVSFASPVCTLVGYRCSVTLAGSAPGSVTIQAAYGGDINNIGSYRTRVVTVK